MRLFIFTTLLSLSFATSYAQEKSQVAMYAEKQAEAILHICTLEDNNCIAKEIITRCDGVDRKGKQSKKRNGKILGIQERICETHIKIAQEKKNIAQLKERGRQLDKDNAQLDKDIAQGKKNIAQLDKDIAQLDKDIAQLKEEIRANINRAQKKPHTP